MHVLIIGAAGMVGQKLAQRLTRDGELQGKPIAAMTLADVVPAEGPVGFDGKLSIETADLSEPGAAERLVALRPDVIFHLAAIVSGEAELDFEKGYRINLDGTRYLFEAIRLAHNADGYRPRVVFTSSIAVVGAPSISQSLTIFTRHLSPATGRRRRSANCCCRIILARAISTASASGFRRSAFGRASPTRRRQASFPTSCASRWSAKRPSSPSATMFVTGMPRHALRSAFCSTRRQSISKRSAHGAISRCRVSVRRSANRSKRYAAWRVTVRSS